MNTGKTHNVNDRSVAQIKSVLLFTLGDSNKLITWSNVPFLLAKSLLQQGIEVHRINISLPYKLYRIYDKTFTRILQLFFPETSYDFLRTRLHFLLVRGKIKKAVRDYSNVDAHIFLTYSYSSLGYSSKPVFMFCDRTYEMYIKDFLKRKPDFFERNSIDRENRIMENADAIFSLYPKAKEYLINRYPDKKVFYLGNILNIVIDPPSIELVQTKMISNSILFIGGKHYFEGAKCLISAFRILKKENPKYTLDIIAMNSTDFVDLPESVTCHGYLNKANENQRDLYYRLLKEAKIIINTTPNWGGFSSIIEAMYFYTPVITSSYPDFLETFGHEINFGEYCENDIDKLVTTIKKIITGENYRDLCINAHNAVRESTWEEFTKKMLKLMSEIILPKQISENTMA